MSDSLFITPNPRASRCGSYPESARAVISLDAAVAAQSELRKWSGYAVTPLISFDRIARAAGVCAIWLKDEGSRFGLGSFKALGGALAVRRIKALQPLAVRATVACASAGNHGRAVAWGAQQCDANCVVYLHKSVSAGRVAAIAQFGATVVRVAGTLSEAAQVAERDAIQHGWQLVPETSDQANMTSLSILAGYGTLLLEVLAQLGSAPPPTHIFVPAGAGGLAASVCGLFWERFGADRPRCIVVEPLAANSISQSLSSGMRVDVPESSETIMTELAHGTPSELAWSVLEGGLDFGIAIGDDLAVRTMRGLAVGAYGQLPIVLGESGVSGFAALAAILHRPDLREQLGLDGRARALVIGTETATDEAVWESLVGFSPRSALRGRK